MYRETGRAGDGEEFASIAETTWEPLTVPVPRCLQCKQAHDRRERFVEKGWKVGLLLGILLVAAGFIFSAMQINRTGLAGRGIAAFFIARRAIILVPAFVFSCAIAGGLLAWLAGKSSIPQGVKDQSASVLHPNIKSMEQEGWKIGAKPPRG
jgi:hypothetical protein